MNAKSQVVPFKSKMKTTRKLIKRYKITDDCSRDENR